jgi:hypothetical protein
MTTLAREIHNRQALDLGHGKYTDRCICNLHADSLLRALPSGWCGHDDADTELLAEAVRQHGEIARLRGIVKAELDEAEIEVAYAGRMKRPWRDRYGYAAAHVEGMVSRLRSAIAPTTPEGRLILGIDSTMTDEEMAEIAPLLPPSSVPPAHV